MKRFDDLDGRCSFERKMPSETLEEFLECSPMVSEEAYANFYGACVPLLMQVLPASVKVFMWMVYNCELNKGRVTIQSIAQRRLLKECGISQVSYFKSLRDLREHDMIRGYRAVYYINPRLVWRGGFRERLRFMEQYPFIPGERDSDGGEMMHESAGHDMKSVEF